MSRRIDDKETKTQTDDLAELVDKSHRICKYMVVFEILFAQDVEKDLKKLTAYHRKTVLDAIEIQLANGRRFDTESRCW